MVEQEEQKFVFSAQCEKRKMKRGGRNQNKSRKNHPLTLIVDPFVRQKSNKKIWVKKEDLKERFPLSMYIQNKSQTWENKKIESNSFVWTQTKKVWKKKEDNLLKGIRSFVSLQ